MSILDSNFGFWTEVYSRLQGAEVQQALARAAYQPNLEQSEKLTAEVERVQLENAHTLTVARESLHERRSTPCNLPGKRTGEGTTSIVLHLLQPPSRCVRQPLTFQLAKKACCFRKQAFWQRGLMQTQA